MRIAPFNYAVALAVIAFSTFGFVGAAGAATPGVNYVVASDVAAGAIFGQDGWGNAGIGPVSSSTAGLSLPVNSELTFGVPTTLPIATGTALVDFAGVTLFNSSDVPSFQALISYRDSIGSQLQFYALTVTGDFSAAILWETNTAVGSYPAYEQHTLAEFDTALFTDLNFTTGYIEGASAFNSGLATHNVTDFKVNGVQYIFTPQPVFTAPTTITLSDFENTGFTVTTSGFLPNESGIRLFVTAPTGPSSQLLASATADANGVANYTYFAPGTELGNYQFVLDGSVPNSQSFDFTVVTSSAPAAAPSLAATGSDVIFPVVTGFALLLLGLTLAIGASRRQSSRRDGAENAR